MIGGAIGEQTRNHLPFTHQSPEALRKTSKIHENPNEEEAVAAAAAEEEEQEGE